MLKLTRLTMVLVIIVALFSIGCALTQPTCQTPGEPGSPAAGQQLITVNSDVLLTILGALGGVIAGWLGLKRPGDIARPTPSPSPSQL